MRELTPTRVNHLDGAGLGLRRQFLELIGRVGPRFHRLLRGCPRELDEGGGQSRQALSCAHGVFSRWAKSGVWERVFKYLALDADNEYAMIDATIVRAHQHSAGAQKKPAKTKRSDAAEAD